MFINKNPGMRWCFKNQIFSKNSTGNARPNFLLEKAEKPFKNCLYENLRTYGMLKES